MRKQLMAVWKEVKMDRRLAWASAFLGFMMFVALFADFIAGDHPVLWKDGDGISSPLFSQYAGELRHGSSFLQRRKYKEEEADWSVWPLIRYSPSRMDRETGGPVAPLKEGHPLGTDELGRDVASGLVHGTRITLSVSILAVLLAAIIGLLLGMPPAFYGDHKLKAGLIPLLLYLLLFPLIIFYANIVAGGFEAWWARLFVFLLLVLLGIGIVHLCLRPLKKYMPIRKELDFPADILFMRGLEVFKALPALYIILSVLVLVEDAGIWTLVLLISFLMWVSFARFIRGEFLSLREQPFVKRLLLEGKSDAIIMAVHMLPNAITPIIVLASFAMGSAIILESTLSFLGLGLPPDFVSWGSIMSQARTRIDAWWLAVFPGLAILLTVLAFNTIGRAFNERVREDLKYSA